MTYQGITKAWQPPISRTPAIRRHRLYRGQYWMGDAVYTKAEFQEMIAGMQLVIAEDEAAERLLKSVDEVRQLTEASACPL